MRQGAGMARGERGAVMIFVLMMIVLICALTIGVMRIIGGGVAGGAQSLEADQVFNIARAGLHYAMGRLQITVAASYAGETVSSAIGPAPMASAAGAVTCTDTWPAPRSPAAAAAARRSRAAPPRTPPSRSACP